MKVIQTLRQLAGQIDATARSAGQILRVLTQMREALGRIETRQCAHQPKDDFRAHEFQVYSQWGEDGLIQHLLREVKITHKIFVEFGVETYTEASTRFLLTHDNWSGLIMDGSASNIRSIRRSELYWRHNLKAAEAFITRENINDLLTENGVQGEIGLLSIDIDGNDYWVWEAINVVNPAVVIVEYNARFGPERAVSVPYDPSFVRQAAHHSCIYYGVSLAALVLLGRAKGYAFVGANSAGNNAFFVRRDLLPPTMKEISAAEGYVPARFRESRDAQGKLTFLTAEEETQLLTTLPLVDVAK